MMLASADFPGALRLDYEAWRELVREMCGGYNPEGIEPSTFSGWVRPVSVCGFTAAEVGCNAQRVERTYRDVRLDGADQYLAVFQLAGQSAVNHNGQAAQLNVGDVILVDAARPATFFAGNPGERWESLTLVLPRQSLVSHLGFEPQGGLYRRGGTSAGRLLIDLIRNAEAVEEDTLSPTDSYMKLVVYDLVGALFAPSSQWRASRHADKVFMRVRDIIKDGFADPDFGPCELAAKAGISLRYLHKLFTQRDSTCSEFIYSARLNYASQLLHRRASLSTRQALSEIAYACGFRDYPHFARRFRRRFGHVPGAHSTGRSGAEGEGSANTDENAPMAHDTPSAAIQARQHGQ
jgi:AraC family transcriptional regulator, positive regulator of tynA and feaB